MNETSGLGELDACRIHDSFEQPTSGCGSITAWRHAELSLIGAAEGSLGLIADILGDHGQGGPARPNAAAGKSQAEFGQKSNWRHVHRSLELTDQGGTRRMTLLGQVVQRPGPSRVIQHAKQRFRGLGPHQKR